MTGTHEHQRRQFLAQLVRFLFLLGFLAFTWVIVSSLSFTWQGEERQTQHGIEVDVSHLQPGQLHKVSLHHKEVWIYHRSVDEINQLKKQNLPLRSQHDAYFVFYPYEPKRQCVVNWDESSRRFYDTCNARYFDLAGRVVGQEDSLQVELAIPGYRFLKEQLIQIDAR